MNAFSGANFVDTMSAAADFLGNGAIEINMYETEIADLVRRESMVLPRLNTVRATGHPHRYFEQTDIATATFQDPRNISPTASGPTRVERPAFLKALTGQSNFSLFDVEVTKQQGQFASVEAKDVEDIVSSIERLRGANIWNGNDTSLSTPTTLQYVGLLTQITQQATILNGASIIDGLKAQVALMASNAQFVVRPTAIVINQLLGDLIDREAKATKIVLGNVDIGAGITVQGISTQAGVIPLIPDVYMPTIPVNTTAYGFTTPTNLKGYLAAILTENWIEIPVLSVDGNPNPRLFQLGLLGNLARQMVGVKFDCVIAKGPSYAHSVVCVNRP